MALTSVLGCCKRYDSIDADPLFEHTQCVNSLFACKCDPLDNFSTSDRHGEGSFTLHVTHCGS